MSAHEISMIICVARLAINKVMLEDTRLLKNKAVLYYEYFALGQSQG